MKDDEYYRLVSVRRRFGGMFDRERLLGRQILTKNLEEVQPGAFIIARMQIVHGACCLVPQSMMGAATSKSYIQFVGSPGCDIRFFARLAETAAGTKLFLDASQGVVVEKMTFDLARWLSFAINLPPINEQRRVVKILGTLDEAIHKTAALIAKLKQVKQGLLHDLLTRGIDDNGELRDPERHPEQFKDSPLGRIPKAWKTQDLDETVTIIDCKHFTPAYVGEGYPVVRPRNVKAEGLDWSDIDFVTERDFQSLTDKHAPGRGDIVFSRNASFGIPCYVDTDRRFAIGQDVVVMVQRSVDTRFLFYALQSGALETQVARQSGGSTFARINLAAIRSLTVPLPPDEEQRGIARTLASFDDRVTGERHELAKLGLLKQGLMEDLLTGRVRVAKLVEEAAE